MGAITVKNRIGQIVTLVLFFITLVVGLTGLVQMEKDFKIEWFFPPGSYVEDYLAMNKQYFSRGLSFTVYADGIDFYAQDAQVKDVTEYMSIQEFMVPDSITLNWHDEFLKSGKVWSDSAEYWETLWNWFNTEGTRHKSAVQWTAGDCDGTSCTAKQKQQGITHAKLFQGTLKDKDTGKERYEIYRTMREDLANLATDGVFPYEQSFLYWEEIGIIDAELIRNLIIAFALVCAIIAFLIPIPRIGVVVAVNIVAAILEVIGFSHYWGVKMNGPSTIYYLICAGLSVDYSAHVAHVFKDETGTSVDRAIQAMSRICPSVMGAIISTLLAVVVLATSKSFIFEIFFKVLFLVSVIAGAHGVWLLPTLLGIVGGYKEPPPPTVEEAEGEVEKGSSPDPLEATEPAQKGFPGVTQVK